jgi:hypothetical protein
LKPLEQLINDLAGKPFSLKGFFRDNLIGILSTLIFHILLLIFFLLFKIDSFRQIKDLGVVLDFTYEMEEREKETDLSPEEMAQIAMYERLLERAMRESNQPRNISEQLEKKISTDDFVNEVEQLLKESRSEEEKKRLQEMEELLAIGVTVPEKKPDDLEHIQEFKGPTRISFEFNEPPYDRYGAHIPVPVYKCQGGGVVEVEIIVDQSGNVTSAKPLIIGTPNDASCLAEAAVKFAMISKFTANPGAPKNHKGKIRYSFVAQ